MKKSGIDYIQFDKGQIGATIAWFPPQTRWFSSNERIAIAGVPLSTPDQSKATREQYLCYLRNIVTQYDLAVRSYERVTDVVRDGDAFEITTDPRGETYRAHRVVFAVGGTDKPRMLGVPGEDLPHVDHYFHEPHKYFRNKVVVIGGRNSAIEAALRCHHVGASVTLSYRRDAIPDKHIKYWLMPEIGGLMRAGKIAGEFGTTIVAITPTHVRLKRTATGEEFDVLADFVLALTGYLQDNSLMRRAGIEIVGECGTPRFSEATMETNVPGIHVAGTAVAGTQGDYKFFLENSHVHVTRIVNAICGTGECAVAAVEYVNPES